MTEDRFIELVNAFKFRESQMMELQEKALEFEFKWYDLNLINKCLRFHDHHKPDKIGSGNQATAPESEFYMQHQILIEGEDSELPTDRPSGSTLARFLYYQPDFRYAPGDIRNYTFGEGMFD